MAIQEGEAAPTPIIRLVGGQLQQVFKVAHVGEGGALTVTPEWRDVETGVTIGPYDS